MTKPSIEEKIKEFEKWHNKISLSHWGKFPSKWRQTSEMKADIKNGYWYWEGHKIADLINKIMKEKVLCDRCKCEFEANEEDLTTYDGRPVKEVICNNCKEDSVLDFITN